MKAKGSLSVLAVLLVGWLLVSGISAFAQLNLNVNGNVNYCEHVGTHRHGSGLSDWTGSWPDSAISLPSIIANIKRIRIS